MTAQPIEQLDPDFLKDADSTAELPVAGMSSVAGVPAPVRPVSTVRLSALLPPPPSAARPGMPPHLPTAPMLALAPVVAAPVATPRRPSWIRDLIAGALAPAAGDRVRLDERLTRRTAGAACVGAGIAFGLAALVTGLRGAPDASLPIAIGASLVMSRALVALGAGLFSYALLRMAERLLTPPSGPSAP